MKNKILIFISAISTLTFGIGFSKILLGDYVGFNKAVVFASFGLSLLICSLTYLIKYYKLKVSEVGIAGNLQILFLFIISFAILTGISLIIESSMLAETITNYFALIYGIL